LSNSSIHELLQELPKTTLLVLDEAYLEYRQHVEPSNTLNLLSSHPNLIIMRTFSKAYGLAGLRLGYLISNPALAAVLAKVQPPFTINRAALVAAHAALTDPDFMKQAVANNTRELRRVEQGLKKIGLTTLPSAGNFITFRGEHDAMPLYQSLLEHGIIVRPLHKYGLDAYLRVSIGTPEQNCRFLSQMELYHHEK